MSNIINSNKVNKAEEILESMEDGTIIKRIKRDRGLMERSNNSEKIIIAEDNRQVIFG